MINKLEEAFDEFLEEYVNDHTIVHGDEGQKKYKYYKSTAKQISEWKKSKKCIHRNCNYPSVRRSHTIQKSSSLKLISENGVVLTPEYTLDGLKLKETGINWASAFPGFCEKHEKLFKDFEIKKKITRDSHYTLQIYRSICREIVRIEHEIHFLKEAIETHISDRNNYINKKVEEKLESKVECLFLNVSNDEAEIVINQIIQGRKEQLHTLQNYHLKQVEKAISSPDNFEISGVKLTIDCVIPVCLSGLFDLTVEENGITNNILTIITVLPFEDSTIIGMSGRSEDCKSIQSYFAQYNDSPSILNMVENWMLFGTDHWFLKPSVWETIPTKIRKKILYDFRHANFSLEYQHSIFNEIRMALIESAREQLSTPGKKEYFQSIIEKESKKYNN